jgi:hypothetical protein
MTGLGRTLILVGLLLVVMGTVALLFSRMHVPLGRLPGDFTWRGRSWSVSFPLATSVVVSVLLSLLLWVVNWLRR